MKAIKPNRFPLLILTKNVPTKTSFYSGRRDENIKANFLNSASSTMAEERTNKKIPGFRQAKPERNTGFEFSGMHSFL